MRNGGSLLFNFRPTEDDWAGILISFKVRRSALSTISRPLRLAIFGKQYEEKTLQESTFLLKATVFQEDDAKPVRTAAIPIPHKPAPVMPIQFQPIPHSKGVLFTVVLELVSPSRRLQVSCCRREDSVTSYGSRAYKGISPVMSSYYSYPRPQDRNHVSRLVSVLIVTYNAEGYLRKCLDSIAAQDYPNIEIVIVDNASQDATAQIIERDFPDVKLLRMSSNLDFCKGNNMGVPHCSGKYLFILNADTEIEPHTVTTLVDSIEDADNIAVAAPIISTKASWSRYANVFLTGRITGNEALLSESRLIAAPCGASFLVKASVVKELGYLFDEGYVTNWEDHDFGLRCWLHGYACVHTPEPLVWHIGGGVYGLLNSKRYRKIVRNELLTYFKNLTIPSFAKAFLFRAAASVRRLNMLIGVFIFLRDFWKFIPERNRLQDARKIDEGLLKVLASGVPYKLKSPP